MQSVLITGASRGMGKSTAEKFLEEGWSVIGTTINRSTGNLIEHENLHWLELDLVNPDSIKDAVQNIGKPIDVLINNAGTLMRGEQSDAGSVDIKVLRETLEVNLFGTIDFTEQMLAANLINRKGRIISMGSQQGGLSGEVMDFVPSYKISKVGLSMYTRVLADRLRGTMTVSILDPGWVATDMGGGSAPRNPEEPARELFELATKDIPTGRFWKEGNERSW